MNFTLVIASPQAIGAYTIDWGDGSPMQFGGSLVAPQTVNHVYAAAVAQYTVTFTETGSGCVITGTVIMEQSTSASIQIPVGGLTQICAPQAVQFINSSTNVSPNTVFTWNFGDGSPPQTFDHTNLGQTLTHTYQQGTVSCETTVLLTAANACNTLQGGQSNATFNPIRVWDIDSARIAPSATLLCWPDNEVTFMNVTMRNCLQQGNIFQRYEYWNFGDYWGTGQDSIIDWTPWPPTFPRTIAYPAIGTYEVMMLDSNYCGIDTAYVTINIVPPPTVALSATPTTICAGETVNFTQTTAGGANYFQWNFGTGNGFQWTAAGNQSFTYAQPGIYTVYYTASIQGATAGCSDTASVVITVLPRPTAGFNLDSAAACEQITVAIENTSISAVSHSWDFGDGTTSTDVYPPPHTYDAVGEYVITLTVTNALGCSHAYSRTVNVYAPPTATIQANNLCLGNLTQFTPQVTTAAGNPIISWAWDFGDGTTASVQNPNHLYAGAGTQVVTLQVTTPYCSGSATQWVNIQPQPEATFTADPVLGCAPMAVNFTNSTSGASQYAWNFGDGATSSAFEPAHTFLNPGPGNVIRTVQLTATSAFGCTDVMTAQITIAPGAVASFTHNGLPGCAPLDVTFNNFSTGASSYTWDFGDGTVSTDAAPQHTYINTTYSLAIHQVTLIAHSAAGCADTTVAQVMVYPTPDFTFSATPANGCSPHTVVFPSIVGAVTYQWDFGDGNTGIGASPTHTYINNTAADAVHPITLIGSNAFGCVDTAFSSVTVYPVPSAQFDITQTTGCHPVTATLNNLSTGGDQFAWNYGDGQIGATATAHEHTWTNFQGPNAATYPVILTVTSANGCTNSTTSQVEVYPEVTAALLGPDVGCSPLTATFMNLSTGATMYYWDMGNGMSSTAPAPIHTFTNQGLNDIDYQVMLVSTSDFGCTDTAYHSILVHPQPIAQFLPSTEAGCQPLNVDFQDFSLGASTMQWVFGDGDVLNTGTGGTSHSYTSGSPGITNFQTQLIATSQWGCTDTATTDLQVYPPVIASFQLDSVGCSPVVLDVNNTSTGATMYSWNMGDGNTLIGDTPNYTYVNNSTVVANYPVTLTATSAFGCASTATQVVVVHPVPEANFQASPLFQQFPNSTVEVVNSSSAGNWTYSWAWGDGGTSNAQAPAPHAYATWGSYTITLVVSSIMCSDTASTLIMIQSPVPMASFMGSGSGCTPLTVSFDNTSLQAMSYQWQFGDGGMSTADDPTYIYNVPGTYTVSLIAYGVGGEVNTAVKVDSIVVHPRANAYFVLQPEAVVVPNQPVFTYNLSSFADQFTWDMGDGTITSVFAPQHLYTQPGTYDVMLVANNQWDCPDTFVVVGAVEGSAAGDLQFPNAFAPGNSGPTDGVYEPHDNTHFHPHFSGVERYRLEVFNRWGELVFITEDIRKGWDGYYRGKPAKQDVYVWKAHARFSDGREEVLKGDVTLLR